jgi:hypothetical protein
VELDSAHNKHYIFLDFDLSNKLKQRMISDFDLNVFRSLDVIYLERSFHGGLHFLVCVDDQVVKTYNKIAIKETSFIPTYVHRYYAGSKRVYNVIPMEQTIMKHNYPPFTEADYTRLRSRYEEMMVHAVSAP